MNNIVESVVFTILGLAVVGTAIEVKAGWEVLGLGIAISVAAVGCLIYSLIKNKK